MSCMNAKATVVMPTPHKKTRMEKLLDTVERVGNKVPHPAVIFVILIGIVVVLSHIFYLMGVSATYESINPETDKVEEVTTAAKSLLTADGIRFMYEEVVKNFMRLQRGRRDHRGDAGCRRGRFCRPDRSVDSQDWCRWRRAKR